MKVSKLFRVPSRRTCQPLIELDRICVTTWLRRRINPALTREQLAAGADSMNPVTWNLSVLQGSISSQNMESVLMPLPGTHKHANSKSELSPKR